MRVVSPAEKKKRGCENCKNSERIRAHGVFRLGCSFAKCPYHVLDKYDTYDEFLASEDSKIHVDGFFQTVPSCYELTNGNMTIRQIYCDKEINRFL